MACMEAKLKPWAFSWRRILGLLNLCECWHYQVWTQDSFSTHKIWPFPEQLLLHIPLSTNLPTPPWTQQMFEHCWFQLSFCYKVFPSQLKHRCKLNLKVCNLQLELGNLKMTKNMAESFMNWKLLHQSKWICSSFGQSIGKFVWTKLSISHIHLWIKAGMSVTPFCIGTEDQISWSSLKLHLPFQSYLGNALLCTKILWGQSHFILRGKVMLPSQHKFSWVMALNFEFAHTA